MKGGGQWVVVKGRAPRIETTTNKTKRGGIVFFFFQTPKGGTGHWCEHNKKKKRKEAKPKQSCGCVCWEEAGKKLERAAKKTRGARTFQQEISLLWTWKKKNQKKRDKPKDRRPLLLLSQKKEQDSNVLEQQ
jgi:hypothetical protein